MKTQTYGSIILHFLRTSLLIDLGIFVVTGLLCWIAGWRTAHQYGTALVYIGVAAVLLGLVSIIGGWQQRGDFDYQYGRSVSSANVSERASKDLMDTLGSYRFLIQMLLTAVLPLAIGTWLQTF